ncbi:SH3 domain-containing protein [Leptospira venezuelensis]|uniref:SH3 domain-containing protein n=1 Tax=Leptospira venezuelensis TaxID=1958811 RepID=UPI000A3A52BF|nr:SH3 domain-containing protein [Leptospira venezuelensis]
MISGFFYFKRSNSFSCSLIFFIFIIYFFASNLPISSDSDRKLQTLFVTADILNVRIRPDKKSDKIGFLPYGTKIQTEKAQTFEIQNGIKVYWYYYPESNGYVLGEFLSNTEPAKGKKKTVLYKLYRDRCAQNIKQSLALYANIADLYVDMQEEGGGCSTGLLRGKYTFNQNVLVISDLKGVGLKNNCPFDDNKVSFAELEKRLLNIARVKGDLYLRYDPDLDGLVTEEVLKQVSSEGWKVNKSKCSFEKYFECKYTNEPVLTSKGYFCFKENSL